MKKLFITIITCIPLMFFGQDEIKTDNNQLVLNKCNIYLDVNAINFIDPGNEYGSTQSFNGFNIAGLYNINRIISAGLGFGVDWSPTINTNRGMIYDPMYLLYGQMRGTFPISSTQHKFFVTIEGGDIIGKMKFGLGEDKYQFFVGGSAGYKFNIIKSFGSQVSVKYMSSSFLDKRSDQIILALGISI